MTEEEGCGEKQMSKAPGGSSASGVPTDGAPGKPLPAKEVSATPRPAPGSEDARPRRRHAWLLALLSAPLFALSFPDAAIAPLIYVALVPLLFALPGLSGKRRFGLGVLVGGLAWGIGYYCVARLLTLMSDVPPVLAWPLFALVAAYHGLQWGLWAWLAGWLRDLSPRWDWLTTATAWTALELLFPLLFPLYPGSATAPLGPMASALDLVGVHGMGWLLVAGAVLLTRTLRRLTSQRSPLRRARGQPGDERGQPDRGSAWKPALAVLGGVLLLLGYGLWREPAVRALQEAGQPLRFALVQPNFSAAERKSADGETMSTIGRRVLAQLASLPVGELDLVLLGEGSFPFPFIERPAPALGEVELPTDRFAAAFRAQARRSGAHLVFGTPRFDSTAPDAPARNSLVHLLPTGATARIYDKVRLVPFGERMPLGFLRSLFPRFDDLTPGTDHTPFEVAGHRLAPTICYELMFAGDGRAALAGVPGAPDASAPRPGAFLNATNDVWFGVETNAAALHLAMQRARAIENRVALLRAANTGISALVLPDGSLPLQGPLGTAEILRGTVKLAHLGSVYGTLGEWWFSVPALATLLVAALALRRRRKSS